MHQHDCQFWKPNFPCNLQHYNLTKCIIDMLLRWREFKSSDVSHAGCRLPRKKVTWIYRIFSLSLFLFRWKIADGLENDKKFKWSPFINYRKNVKTVSSWIVICRPNRTCKKHRHREYGLRVARMFARGEISGSKTNKLFHHRQLIDPEINETWLLHWNIRRRTRELSWLPTQYGSTVSGGEKTVFFRVLCDKSWQKNSLN